MEQENFPAENSGYKLLGAVPCTDGETLFVPKGYGQEAFLFHELGHLLLHYPNGPDPGLIDPDVRNKSKWEAEACLFGRLVCKALDLDPGYNDDFLIRWIGDPSRLDYGTVFQKAAEVIQRYRTHAKGEDFEDVLRPNLFSEGWYGLHDYRHEAGSLFDLDGGDYQGAEGGEEGLQGTLPLATRRFRGY